MANFAGKTVFVTGGGRGIGWAIAQGFAVQGARIAIADIDADIAQAAATRLEADGAEAMGVVCDVADRSMVDIAVLETTKRFGGVDFLINNAGRHLLRFAVPITELSADDWREMLEVNIVGIVNCTAACRGSMRDRGGGVVINMGSIAGIAATNCYGVSKLAVRGLTVGLAQELAADGTRVCGVAPGLVDSPAAMDELSEDRKNAFIRDFQLVKRQGRMTDVANLVEYLCSDLASFITGETIAVSGGFPLRP